MSRPLLPVPSKQPAVALLALRHVLETEQHCTRRARSSSDLVQLLLDSRPVEAVELTKVGGLEPRPRQAKDAACRRELRDVPGEFVPQREPGRPEGGTTGASPEA